MKYRKKPVEIEAARFDGRHVGETDEDGRVLRGTRPKWLPQVTRDVTGLGLASLTNARPGELYAEGDKLLIVTTEGVMAATPGDWIIRGIAGELYPCKPDIFAATYEPAPGSGSTPSGGGGRRRTTRPGPAAIAVSRSLRSPDQPPLQ